ncbi:MAG: glutaredoxin 3 [Candidatus Gracilibacteria bacterium]|jgi:glutaredoxin 3|nr:glutaredoxin 3 [Candidatus Gracilibacteria bacterium]
MAEIVMYTKDYCPFSKEAKAFFEEKGKNYSEIQIQDDAVVAREMEEKSGGRTDTPQIFVNGSHIGSFDDIKALEATGNLDELLK